MPCELENETVAGQFGPGVSPSEEQTHREHRAALEATLFRRGASVDREVVFVLDAGKLSLRAPRG